MKFTPLRLIEPVLDEINETYGTGYTPKNVYFKFEREMIVNELDNAQIELVKAQTKQTNITTILNVNSILGQQLVQEQVCEELELDYEDIKDKLPKQEVVDLDAASEELVNAEEEPIDEEEAPIE